MFSLTEEQREHLRHQTLQDLWLCLNPGGGIVVAPKPPVVHVYVITGGHPDLVADMSQRELLEDRLSPSTVYATLNGAMRALEEEIADYAADSLPEGMQLPLTVEWKRSTYPVPKGTTITGQMWETTNPFTEETLQIHEMVLGE